MFGVVLDLFLRCIDDHIIFVLTASIAEYVCHVFVRSDSLGAVLIGDHEYPSRVAFTLLNKVRPLDRQFQHD